MFSRAATTRNDWSAADWYFLMDFCLYVFNSGMSGWLRPIVNHLSHCVNIAQKE